MKNDLFLKISALLLVLLLCAPLLMACNDTTWQPPSDPSGGGELSGGGSDTICPPRIPRFDGETINFYVNETLSATRSIDLGDADDPTHTVNVAVKKRNEQVEKELGVDIVLKTVSGIDESFTHLQPILASTIYRYDAVLLNHHFDMKVAIGDTLGAFYNLNDLPEDVPSYLDLEASYWDKNLLERQNYKGVNFFLTGDIALSHTDGMYVSFVNADMWAEYADRIKTLEHSGGYSDIYDIVKNGYWTLDLWMELAKLCYEDDGDELHNDKDQCGFMVYEQCLYCTMVDALAAGSGVHFGGSTADGTPTVEIYSKKNIAFYEKLYTLLCQSDTVTIPRTNDDEDKSVNLIMDIFAKGNVLLNVNTLKDAIESLSNMEDDYLVMPLPLFDHEQFDKASPSLGYATRYDDTLSQIAICTAIGNDKLPAVTATLELMAYYSEKWVTPAYRQEILKGRYEENKEMLELIEKGVYDDFVFVWSHSLDHPIWYLRQHYTEYTKIDNHLRGWDRMVTGLLVTKVLDQIEECIYY